MTANPLEEPIGETWRQSQQWAKQLCVDCGWYHGLWQYLRLMGMGKTLSGQSGWFLQQIRRYQGGEPPSILISGCADYSAFFHVIEALELGKPPAKPFPRIVAVDRCRTPLELNNLIAARTGVPIVNHAVDILRFQTEERFDVIFTSSFLGFFNPIERIELFRKHHSLLKTGGELVFANRLRPGTEDERVPLSPAAIEQAVLGALALNRRLKIQDAMHEDELATRIREYVGQASGYPVNSSQSVQAALRAAGFADIRTEERRPELPQHEVQVRGATFAEDAPYLCVVARR